MEGGEVIPSSHFDTNTIYLVTQTEARRSCCAERDCALSAVVCAHILFTGQLPASLQISLSLAIPTYLSTESDLFKNVPSQFSSN